MQLHLYVSDDVAEAVRKRAESRGVSTSRYLADLVARDVQADWPAGFFEKVIGGWQGEVLERPPQGTLEAREEL